MMKCNLFSTMSSVTLLMLLMLQLHCSKDPDIIISSPSLTGTVNGRVFPSNPAVKISIVKGTDTIAHTYADTNTGRFWLYDIPRDYYMMAISNRFCTTERPLSLRDAVYWDNQINIYAPGQFIISGNYLDVDTLPIESGLGDSLLTISFLLYDSAFVDKEQNMARIQPEFLQDYCMQQTPDLHTIKLYFPKQRLFSVPQITITLYAKIRNGISPVVLDSTSIRYQLDTTGINHAITNMLVRGYSPRGTSTFFREGTIDIWFARPMNHDSVQKSISIIPLISKSFSWSDNTLTIIPANTLAPNTRYTLSIGSGAMTLDSIYFRTPFEFDFSTGDRDFFETTWPSDSAINIPLNVPFQFKSPYSLEPELLQSAFTITPTIDSLLFLADSTGHIRISHAPLQPATNYQITINKSCQSRKGTLLGVDKTIIFRTITSF